MEFWYSFIDIHVNFDVNIITLIHLFLCLNSTQLGILFDSYFVRKETFLQGSFEVLQEFCEVVLKFCKSFSGGIVSKQALLIRRAFSMKQTKQKYYGRL